MRRNLLLDPACRRARDHVLQRLPSGQPPQATRAPTTEIFCHRALDRLSENAPRFPARPRHHRDLRKVLLCAFRFVAAAKGLDETDYLAALLKAGVLERVER